MINYTQNVFNGIEEQIWAATYTVDAESFLTFDPTVYRLYQFVSAT